MVIVALSFTLEKVPASITSHIPKADSGSKASIEKLFVTQLNILSFIIIKRSIWGEDSVVRDMSSYGGRVCKFDSAFTKYVLQESCGYNKGNNNSIVTSLAGGVNNINNNNQGIKRVNGDQIKKKRRQQEKAEMLFHLICWGPN
ncbi:hypothetical protein CUMW_142510 [Citrus unshiu]|nr:hypothetical protein CUMW_142510 [Citrus unshiu]